MATTRKPTAGGRPSPSSVQISDPLNINARLYAQIGRLLDQLEAEDVEGGITIPQRINALIAVGRIQVIFANLRKAAANDASDPGSEVRRYSQAFSKAYGVSRSKGDSRGPELVEFDSDSDDGDGSGDAA